MNYSNHPLKAFDGMKLSELLNTGPLQRHERDVKFDICLNKKTPHGNFNFSSYLNCLEDFQKREGDNPCVRQGEIAIKEFERNKNKYDFWGIFHELYDWFGLK